MTTVNTLMAQQRLHQSREEFRALMTEMNKEQFPRSMTMKYLLGGGGQQAISYLADRTVSKFIPLGGVFRFILMRILLKKFWAHRAAA